MFPAGPLILSIHKLPPFRNKGWPFYLKMKDLFAGGSAGAEGRMLYTTGSRHDLGTETGVGASSHSGYEDQDSVEDTDSYGYQSVLENAMQLDELDLSRLLDLAKNLTSPDPLTRSTATYDAMLTASQFVQLSFPSAVMPPSGFSSESGSCEMTRPQLPSSTRTTQMSAAAKVSKPGSPARTSTVVSNHSPSVFSSRLSKRPQVAGVECTVSKAVAMVAIANALNHVTDCMTNFQSILMTPPGTSNERASSQLPSLSQPPSYRSLAAAHIDNDVNLDPAIRAALLLEFVENDALCQMYAHLQNPALRYRIAVSWYQDNHPSSSNTISITSPTSQ